MTTQCCEKCEKIVPTDQHPDSIHQLTYCSNVACKCHQTHTTEEGWRERVKADFEANMLDGEDVKDCGGAMLSAESVLEYILDVTASEIQKAQVKVLDEVKLKLERMMWAHEGDTGAARIHRKIHNDTLRETLKMLSTNKQSEV